jgi:SAM-dependent methyltransferase
VFTFLAQQCPAHDLAWDCGTGNGQAALGLAGKFRAVHATDPSEQQLAHAHPHPSITYRQTDETASGLPSGSVDLVTAAQAAHWFDRDAFYREVRRVTKPGGIVAVWCYGLAAVSPGVDAVVRRFHDVNVGVDWPRGRELVVSLYRDLDFPFDELSTPEFAIEQRLDLNGFVQYVSTWSAVERHQKRTGNDPLPELLDVLSPLWEGGERMVRWPVGIRVGRVPGS